MSNHTPITGHEWTATAHVTEKGLIVGEHDGKPLIVLPNWQWALTDMLSNEGITKPLNAGTFRFEGNRVFERGKLRIEFDFVRKLAFVDVRPFDLGGMPFALYRVFIDTYKRNSPHLVKHPPLYWLFNSFSASHMQEFKDGAKFIRAHASPMALAKNFRTIPVLGFGNHAATLAYLDEMEDVLLERVTKKRDRERLKSEFASTLKERLNLTNNYADYFGVDRLPETLEERIKRLGLSKKWAVAAGRRMAA